MGQGRHELARHARAQVNKHTRVKDEGEDVAAPQHGLLHPALDGRVAGVGAGVLEAAVLAKVAVVGDGAQHSQVRLRLAFLAAAPRGRHCDELRLKVGVARLDNVVHAEAVDAKRVPLLLRKLGLVHQRVRQTWVRKNFGGARNRFEVEASRLNKVGNAQVGDAKRVQNFLPEIDHLRQLLLLCHCRLACQRVRQHRVCQLAALGGRLCGDNEFRVLDMQPMTSTSPDYKAQLHLEGSLRVVHKSFHREFELEVRQLLRDFGDFDPPSASSRPHAARI